MTTVQTEKETLQTSFGDPGVKLLMVKFDTIADTLPMQAVIALLTDDIAKAKRCAYLWDAYKNQMPRIAENILNETDASTVEQQKPRWSFFDWLFNRKSVDING